MKIQAVDVTQVGSWSAATGVNKFKADGDGNYDIKVSFTTSGNVFKAGESVTFQISSLVGLNLEESMFNQLSVGGAKGSFHTAAHVQALSNGGSGWIGDTPEPPPSNGVPDGSWTVTLLGIAAVSLEVFRRRFGKIRA